MNNNLDGETYNRIVFHPCRPILWRILGLDPESNPEYYINSENKVIVEASCHWLSNGFGVTNMWSRKANLILLSAKPIQLTDGDLLAKGYCYLEHQNIYDIIALEQTMFTSWHRNAFKNICVL